MPRFLQHIFLMLLAGLLLVACAQKPKKCKSCNGSGAVECTACMGHGKLDCDWCEGKGDKKCPDCGGAGKRQTNDFKYVTEHGKMVYKNVNVTLACTKCHRSGHIKCAACNGAGNKACPECLGGGKKACTVCMGKGHIVNEWKLIK